MEGDLAREEAGWKILVVEAILFLYCCWKTLAMLLIVLSANCGVDVVVLKDVGCSYGEDVIGRECGNENGNDFVWGEPWFKVMFQC